MATYTFHPPTVLEGRSSVGPEWLRRFKVLRGIALFRDGAVFSETRAIHEGHYKDKVDGVDYFQGGFVYSGVPQEVADVLIASGFADGLVEE